MKKSFIFLIFLILSGCEVSNVDSEMDETLSEKTQQYVNSGNLNQDLEQYESEPNKDYDFEVGVLTDLMLDEKYLEHISKDVVIFNQVESFNKLIYKYIFIIYEEMTELDLAYFDHMKSDVGSLNYKIKDGQIIYSLNVGNSNNYSEYLSQVPFDLFSNLRSVNLTLLEKDYIESEDGELRLYEYKLVKPTDSIGVLTGALAAGTKLSFFPSFSHTTYNDKNDLFNGNHNVLVILQESEFDMGVPAQAYGISLKKGEIASKQVTENLRVIFVRPSNNQRLEIFQLTEEIFQIEGKGAFDDFLALVQAFNNQSITLNEEGNIELNSGTVLETSDLVGIRQEADYCRLEQAPRTSHSEVYGFPIQNIIPHKGIVDVAVIPVDFSDYAGDPSVISQLAAELHLMTDWSNYYSGGEMTYQVHTTGQWIRAPKTAEWYRSRDGQVSEGYQGRDQRILPLLQSQEESVSQLIAASDSLIDWSIIDVVVFIFPVESIAEQTHLYMHMGTFQSPSKGSVRFPVWGENFYELSQSGRKVTFWDWSIHEILHWQGLVGHGPLNHSDYSIMTNQYSSSAGLHAWEAFLLDWWDENDFTCIDRNKIKEPVVFNFDSIDELGAAPGDKSLMIPLSRDEIIVIEYRTQGQWSTLGDEFTGIVIYYIDVNGAYVRCDSCDQLEIEQQNFWRILRNDIIMPCQQQFVPNCGYPSIVQKPGYELIYENLHFKVTAENQIQITLIN